MIVRPPGLPTTATSLPSFATIVGVMLDSMRLPGRDEFGSVPISPSRGQPGPAVEVAHLVVEQEAGARHDDRRAVALSSV